MAMLKRSDPKNSPSGRTKSYRSSRGSTNSKYSQMKKKSNDSRHKIALATSLPKPSAKKPSTPIHYSTSNTLIRTEKLPSSTSVPITGTIQSRTGHSGDRKAHTIDIQTSRDELQNSENHLEDTTLSLDDDYRRNLFGTQPARKHHSKTCLLNEYSSVGGSGGISKRQPNKSIDSGDDIVNKAFNGIFDDEDDDTKNNNTPSIAQIFDKPRRSSTLNDIFDYTKSKNQSTLTKYPSTSSTMLMHNDRTKFDFNNYDVNQYHQPHQHHQPQHHHLQYQYRYPVGDDNENFLRGTTVSQSFIKNVKNVGNYPSGRDGNLVMSSGRKKLQQPNMNQQKRSKSSSEIVDELQRKYFQESGGGGSGGAGGYGGIGPTTITGDGTRNSKRDGNTFKPRTIDRAEI